MYSAAPCSAFLGLLGSQMRVNAQFTAVQEDSSNLGHFKTEMSTRQSVCLEKLLGHLCILSPILYPITGLPQDMSDDIFLISLNYYASKSHTQILNAHIVF